jgi:extradiol dioxygenase family protein
MDVLLDHIVLNVRDIPTSLEFYTSILQFKAERVPKFEAGSAPFPSVRINANTVIDLFPPRMWETGQTAESKHSNLNHFCLALEFTGWKALRQRLMAGGIELHRDMSRNWGARGNGISMYFFDPDGNEIEARYYEDEHSQT